MFFYIVGITQFNIGHREKQDCASSGVKDEMSYL